MRSFPSLIPTIHGGFVARPLTPSSPPSSLSSPPNPFPLPFPLLPFASLVFSLLVRECLHGLRYVSNPLNGLAVAAGAAAAAWAAAHLAYILEVIGVGGSLTSLALYALAFESPQALLDDVETRSVRAQQRVKKARDTAKGIREKATSIADRVGGRESAPSSLNE